jgi:SAM-dependent methyltransferase
MESGVCFPAIRDNLIIQCGALAGAALACAVAPKVLADIASFALVQGLLAAVGCALTRRAWWQCALHGLFLPSVLLVGTWQVPPWVFLVTFVLLALTFGNAVVERVPLYLSGRGVARALAGLGPGDATINVIDLGCGTGTLVARLARLRPRWSIRGVENAPIPFLIGRCITFRSDNARCSYDNLWYCSLRNQDLVYAFLSPAPMRKLWKKANIEMRPGSLLVSNSFPVPGVEPDRVLDVGRRLYLYRIGARRDSGFGIAQHQDPVKHRGKLGKPEGL